MSEQAAIIEKIIRDRKTEKVLSELKDYQPVPEAIATRNNEVVLQAIKTAGWAPFHYARQVEGMAEPWRAHVLWDKEAYKAAVHMQTELGVTTKEPKLALGCSALVIVTWLPEFYDEAIQVASKLPRETQIARDEEHLAAASCMVQNLMLILTGHGMGTYWSSGGKFRGTEMFDYLGIPANERFLAGIFIEYPEMMSDTKFRKPGAQRNNRSESWIREISL